MMPPSGGSVVIEWRWVKTGQTAGFQSFRMRMFKVRGHCRHHKKVNSFMGLKFLSLMVQRLRPAFAEAASRRQV